MCATYALGLKKIKLTDGWFVMIDGVNYSCMLQVDTDTQ